MAPTREQVPVERVPTGEPAREDPSSVPLRRVDARPTGNANCTTTSRPPCLRVVDVATTTLCSMGAPFKSGAEVLPTHTPVLLKAAVARAAELLRAGEPVALPTETVYGLAANALDAQAVAKIFKVKGRPSRNPIIVHVAGVEMARRCVTEWPALADRLAKAFWPGPLTLVLPRSRAIPDIVAAGGATVGVRWPSHPFIQAVIRACDFPLAAPSANLSTQVSPTNAQHVWKGLGDRIRLIVDGGQAQVGIESTVLDLTATPPRVLRPGMIGAESLLAVTGELEKPGPRTQHPPRRDRKSTRLNSRHRYISHAGFFLRNKKNNSTTLSA